MNVRAWARTKWRLADTVYARVHENRGMIVFFLIFRLLVCDLSHVLLVLATCWRGNKQRTPRGFQRDPGDS